MWRKMSRLCEGSENLQFTLYVDRSDFYEPRTVGRDAILAVDHVV
jgi:hypothetical protein